MKAEACPIDGTKVNEPVVRIVAIFAAILTAAGLLFQQPLLIAILIYDFFVRGFIDKKYSVLRWAGMQTNKVLKFQDKWIDAAPKKFAAKIGFIFSVVIFTSLLLYLNTASYIVAGALLVCALLEGLLGYCVGCQFYILLTHLNILPDEPKGAGN